MSRVARILSIGGSDSGGGAGIQADLKTVMALGGYACTAVTAVTAQNTQCVVVAETLAPLLIVRQIEAVTTDIGCDVVKTGMLGTTEIVNAVAACLAKLPGRLPIVVDPVMISTTGSHLLNTDALQALCNKLLPCAALVTPNVPEAEVLSGLQIRDEHDMLQAARAILGFGPKAVMVKGGHLPGNVVKDVLVTLADGEEEVFDSNRIASDHTHGTGCTLAAAIAVSLAQGLTLSAAVVRAREYVAAAISTAPGLGQGHGPLNHAVYRSGDAETASGYRIASRSL